MVDYTFASVVQANSPHLSYQKHKVGAIWEQVYQIWAVPSLEDRCPPPHSTGAAVDVTLVDSTGQTVNMGSAIDELSPRSHPNYFVTSNPVEQHYHSHRQLLWDVLPGFQRHPGSGGISP